MNTPNSLWLTRRGFLAGSLATVAAAVVGCSTDDAADAAATSGSTGAGPSTSGATTAGGSKAVSGTLSIAVNQDVLSLDPQMSRNRLSQVACQQIYDSLVGMDANFKAFPQLAESWSKPDPLTWEFKLRSGVTFHNGKPFTSESVIYTFKRLLDPKTKSPRATMYLQGDVDKIEAVDDLTVRFHTKYDFGDESNPVPLGVWGQVILEPTYTESMSPEEFAKRPMGTGAFKFVEWVPSQRLVMEANTEYWGDGPFVEKVIFKPIPESSTRVSELLSGSVNMIYPVDADSSNLIKGKAQVITAPGTKVYQLGMNVESGPFASKDVRIAMNHAIDKKAIVDSIFGGLATVANQVTFEGQDGYIPDYEGYDYDPELAKKVLAGITEKISLDASPDDQLPAQAIAEQLRQAGLDVTVNSVDAAAFTDSINSGKSTLFYWSFASGEGTFAGSFYNHLFACETRKEGIVVTGFCEPSLDDKMEAADHEPDEKKRNAMFQEVVKGLMEDPPEVPLWNLSEVWGAANNVKGFVGNPQARFYLDQVSITS